MYADTYTIATHHPGSQ